MFGVHEICGRGPVAAVAVISLLTLACEKPLTAESGDGHRASTTTQPLEGYGTIKFGSTFQEAISAVGADLFNSVSVSECFKDLPLKGCYLSRNSDAQPYRIIEGIPYTLSLSFNRFDKLTDIGMNYDREKDISQSDCLNLHERTLDWLAKEYGQFRFPTKQKEQIQRLVTPARNVYEVWTNSNGSAITSPMRTVSSSTPTALEEQPIVKWDSKRYVSLLTTFIVVGGSPICSVNVDFSEPVSVERPVSMNPV